MTFLYYPGCSLKGTERAYDESIRASFAALDVEMEELSDWNCCGATAYMSIDEKKAFALAARNLALAERQSQSAEPTMVVPCSGCYMVLTKTNHYLREYSDLGESTHRSLRAVGLDYSGRVNVRHPLDIIVNEIGVDEVARRAKRSLEGMKVACYYGCQIVRPYAAFDDQVRPTTMDLLLEALGAETIDWPLKTHCCGGSLMGTIQDVALRLNYTLLKEAERRGAEIVATACPLCQLNLECYQDRITPSHGVPVSLPVVYFSQLVGLALGLPPKSLGFERLFVPMPPKWLHAEGSAHVRA